jgi:DNA-binding CsgD family transcriptional regulator
MDTQENRWGIQRQPIHIASFLLVAFGLASISFWTDLLGHSPALSESALAVIPSANPRSFYLLGLVFGGVLFSLLPHRLDFRRVIPHRASQIIAGILFATATCAYAYAGTLEPSVGRLMAIFALATAGLGFAWFSIQFLVQLAQEERYSVVVGTITTGLLLKTLLDATVSLLVPATAQVFIAVALPLVAAALLIASQRCLDRSDDTVDLQELPKIPLPLRRALFLLLLVNSLLRAIIRAMSSMGYWGDSTMPVSQLFLFDFIALAAMFALAAHFTLARKDNPNPIIRFLSAFLVILTGFLILDPQVLAVLQLNSWVAFVLNLFVELFAHLFFWAIIVFGIRSLSIHPFRVAGLAVTLYAVASALLIFAIPTPDSAYRLLAVLVLYAFIVALMFAFRLARPAMEVPLATEPNGTNTAAAAEAEPAPDTNVAPEPDADTQPPVPTATDPATHIDMEDAEKSVVSPLTDLAQSCCLSPRETEVFFLLAQGRSRPYIQQELFLADGTVKTHISRIYTKLGISNRQELITLVQTHHHT